MRYLKRALDLAEARGYLRYPEVLALDERVPAWLRALGTDAGAVVCANCGYDFPTDPGTVKRPEKTRLAILVELLFGTLLVAAAVLGAMNTPANPANWCMVAFAFAVGANIVLANLWPPGERGAPRFARATQTVLAIVAIGSAGLGIWFGVRDTFVVVFFTGAAAIICYVSVVQLLRYVRKQHSGASIDSEPVAAPDRPRDARSHQL